VNCAKGKVGFVEPMLALAVTKLPERPAWTYELKFYGYRALGIKANGRVICSLYNTSKLICARYELGLESGELRIYIQPSYDGDSDSVDGSVRTAQEILLDSAITSVRRGGAIINGRGVIMIAACDVTKALAVLEEAGMRPVLD
jgi:hypothetical protein